jgi:hypothetical protein
MDFIEQSDKSNTLNKAYSNRVSPLGNVVFGIEENEQKDSRITIRISSKDCNEFNISKMTREEAEVLPNFPHLSPSQLGSFVPHELEITNEYYLRKLGKQKKLYLLETTLTSRPITDNLFIQDIRGQWEWQLDTLRSLLVPGARVSFLVLATDLEEVIQEVNHDFLLFWRSNPINNNDLTDEVEPDNASTEPINTSNLIDDAEPDNASAEPISAVTKYGEYEIDYSKEANVNHPTQIDQD